MSNLSRANPTAVGCWDCDERAIRTLEVEAYFAICEVDDERDGALGKALSSLYTRAVRQPIKARGAGDGARINSQCRGQGRSCDSGRSHGAGGCAPDLKEIMRENFLVRNEGVPKLSQLIAVSCILHAFPRFPKSLANAKAPRQVRSLLWVKVVEARGQGVCHGQTQQFDQAMRNLSCLRIPSKFIKSNWTQSHADLAAYNGHSCDLRLDSDQDQFPLCTSGGLLIFDAALGGRHCRFAGRVSANREADRYDPQQECCHNSDRGGDRCQGIPPDYTIIYSKLFTAKDAIPAAHSFSPLLAAPHFATSGICSAARPPLAAVKPPRDLCTQLHHEYKDSIHG